MAVERISGAGALICPLCGGGLKQSGCPTCHLSTADIQRYDRRSGRRWAEPWGRGAWSRLVGLIVYAALVAWSWYFMPTTFLFVLPGALVGAYMQVVRARPLLGAALCAVIVVVMPLLLWPSGLTGFFGDLSGGH